MPRMTWGDFKDAVEKKLVEKKLCESTGEAYDQIPIWFIDCSFPGEMGELMISVDDTLGLAVS